MLKEWYDASDSSNSSSSGVFGGEASQGDGVDERVKTEGWKIGIVRADIHIFGRVIR